MGLEKAHFESLAKALCCWLDYQILCGRGALLSESYLSQPVGEFLTFHYSGDFKSEYPHPQLKAPGRGRPRQIDYALFSRDKDILKYGIEVKWVGNTVPTRQSLTDDILRLECLRPETGKGTTYRYMILGGRKEKIDEALSMTLNNTGITPRPSFLERFLPISNKRMTIDVFRIHKSWRPFFVSFADSYNTELPGKFTVENIANECSEYVRILIWKIGSAGRRTPFDPSKQVEWCDVRVKKEETDSE